MDEGHYGHHTEKVLLADSPRVLHRDMKGVDLVRRATYLRLLTVRAQKRLDAYQRDPEMWMLISRDHHRAIVQVDLTSEVSSAHPKREATVAVCLLP